MFEKQIYQVTQDNQEYILSTYLLNDKIHIECQDSIYSSTPTYGRDYSLQELKYFSEIFSFINKPMEGLNEFNNAIERQQIKITNKGEKMEILFNIQVNSYKQELTLQLPIIKKSQQNFIHKKENDKKDADKVNKSKNKFNIRKEISNNLIK